MTSIPPLVTTEASDSRRSTRPILAKTIRSFEECGFAVTSVNRASETAMVRHAFPSVRFVDIDRTGGAFPDNYGPSIAAILDTCRDQKSCGIINADIYLPNSDIHRLIDESPTTFFVAHRLEVTEIGGDVVGVYRNGIDAMFFDPDQFAALLDEGQLSGFQIGAPFWDSVLPILASFHGTVSFLDPPFICHERHNTNLNKDHYARLRELAIEVVIAHAETRANESAAASAFLRLVDKHVGRRNGFKGRRLTRRAMKVFEFWLSFLEENNSDSVNARIDGILSRHSMRLLTNGDPLPEYRIDVPIDTSRYGPGRRMRSVRTALRAWKRKRRRQMFADTLAASDR